MAFDDIGLGSSPNDGNGDTLRAGGTKINDNYDETGNIADTNTWASVQTFSANNVHNGNNTFAGRNTFNGFFGFGTPESVTIATGVATITKSFVLLAGEGIAADQLDTITSSAVNGDILILSCGNDDITVSEVGNIILGATTRVLSSTADRLMLIFTGTNWIELSYADNA